MKKIEQEVLANPSINWQKVKEVLCGLVSSLQVIIDELPAGTIKLVLIGVASLLEMICKAI